MDTPPPDETQLPPPDISGQPLEKQDAYVAGAGYGSVAANEPDHNGTKVTFNLLASLGFTVLAAWLLVTDLLYPGDPLFQSSWSLPVLALFLLGLTSATFLLAIFPKRIVILANLLFILRSAFGFPLTIWTDNAISSRILSAALLALALYYLYCSLRKLLRVGHRPWMNFPHSFAVFCFGILLALIAVPVTVVGFASAGRNILGDYVRLTPDSISLVERVFRKGDQHVYLVGMMHIGNGAFYDNIQKRMATPPEGEDSKRLVLTEGVSDEDEILPEGFASGETYARWARLFKLEVQEAFHGRETAGRTERDHVSSDRRIHYKNADIDVSELDPVHRETLVTLLELIDQSDPMDLLIAPPTEISGTDIEDLFIKGLIEGRNDTLMQKFETLGPEFSEVYIPWGAAHLTDVEERLLALDYEQVDETIRPIVKFW